MSLQSIPSVDSLLQLEQGKHMVATFGRSLTLQAIRDQLTRTRASVRDGAPVPDPVDLLTQADQLLQSWLTPSLRSVINATGVIIHTNLGRAPLSEAALQAMLDVSAGYSTLEYNLQGGKRGKREQHIEHMLQRLTGAEAAFVVNNNAAAILLALTALARRKEVLVSRSQLIEIGGGFRVPDVMRQSGAKLVEVGTTNRTHLRDFETAIRERTALILRAHHSNFKIIGFTTEPSLSELVNLGNQHDLPVLDDLGSGALLDSAQFGLGHEPMVQESLQAGASIVAFSGDKLLGGPQAGILVGESSSIDKLRKHPLARSVRPDKLCLAALSATLTHYLREEALEQIPVWRMISVTEQELAQRANAWAARIKRGDVIQGRSTVGGGSLPEETLPTWLLALDVRHPNAFSARLRAADPPVVARIEEDQVVLDPRTVLVKQEDELLRILDQVLEG